MPVNGVIYPSSATLIDRAVILLQTTGIYWINDLSYGEEQKALSPLHSSLEQKRKHIKN